MMFRRLQKLAAQPPSESGMTLVELLISIVILGILGSAIGTISMAGMRNHRQTEKEQSAQAAVQSIAYYLPGDASSATTVNVNTSAFDTVCGITGSNLVKLQWTDGITYSSAYKLNGTALARTYCTSSAPTPLTTQMGTGITGTAALTGGLLSVSFASASNAFGPARELYRIAVRPRAIGGGGPGPGGCAGTLALSPNPSTRSGNKLTNTLNLTFTVTSGTCLSPTFEVPSNTGANGTFFGVAPTFTGVISNSVNGWNGPLPQNFTINVVVGGAVVTSAILVVVN
jgi:prepilin-type N-terminal cleavage/methylation domain-containing protein